MFTKPHKAGMTLVELLIALSITAIIGLTVAGAAVAVSSSYCGGEEYNQCLREGREAMLRVQSVARRARLVTAVDSDSVIFWTGDANGDGEISRDELTSIAYDSQAKEIRQYSVVLTPAAKQNPLVNIVKELATVLSANAVTDQLEVDSSGVSTLLASGVKSFKVTASPAPPKADTVTIELTIGQNRRALTLRSSVMLRADQTDSVGVSHKVWVLSL